MRLFLAFDIPPDDILTRLYRELKGSSSSLKPVHPERHHVSLKFLGDPGVPASSVIEGVKGVGDRHGSLSVRLEEAGAFPSWKRPSVLWFGLSEAEKLKDLANDIDMCLHRSIGSSRETREFRAHLTIARCRNCGSFDIGHVRTMMERALEELGSMGRSFVVKELHLYDSTLTPEGPVYRRVGSFLLSGDGEYPY
ncbi:MAG: RNA 2',3'-cyclic phosphodiesterase [Candidatus Thermoplasmatota archaeon]|nr:RNA 2',3'-cyclic phosphodiesterase [Candidatus Thermoplasmatota archaeon]